MRKIAERAQCDHHSTDYSLRATTVTILDQAGFENRDIMAVTGHKSESSLKNYARTSDKKKKMMSAKISKSIQGLPSTSGSNDGLGVGLGVGLRPLSVMTSRSNVVVRPKVRSNSNVTCSPPGLGPETSVSIVDEQFVDTGPESTGGVVTLSQEHLIVQVSNLNIQNASSSTSSVQNFHFHGPVTFNNT